MAKSYLWAAAIGLFLSENSALAVPMDLHHGASSAPPSERAAAEPAIIYLNRCEGGCTVSPGNNSSKSNRHDYARKTGQLGEFPLGDETWNKMVACVQFQFAPYNVTVVETEPDETHFEAMIAGHGESLGIDALGIGTGACGDNVSGSLSLVFAEHLQDLGYVDPTILCQVTAQELGHSMGLEHELEARSPMAVGYHALPDSKTRWFHDVDAQCGGDLQGPNGNNESRWCCSGNPSQNSHEHLLNVFGPRSTPYDGAVRAVTPKNGGVVQPGFRIELQAGSWISKMELLYKGEVYQSSTLPPWIFSSPTEDLGPVSITVRTTDVRGTVGEYQLELTVSETDCEQDPTQAGCQEPAPKPDPEPAEGDSGGCNAAGQPVQHWAYLLIILAIYTRRRWL